MVKSASFAWGNLLKQAHQHGLGFLLHGENLAQVGLGLLERGLLGLLGFAILGELGLDLVGGSLRFDGLLERLRIGIWFAAEAAASAAVNVVARSLELRPDDEVLTTDHEYGACDAAWQRVCAQHGATYRRASIPLPFERERFVEHVLAHAGPRTRLVFASHITSTTALVFPVAELCAAARARGLHTLIDGAHAPGQIGLDLGALGADFYAANLHKWVCAPKGAGFLHARAEHHARLHATVTSWGYAEGTGGHSGFDAYLGRSTLERRLQWQGTRDPSAWLAVPAAIAFHRRHLGPAVRNRSHAMATALLHRVAERTGLAPIAPDDDFAAMVPIAVETRDADALRQTLFERHRIEVPVTAHGGRHFVRVSVAGYTTEADLLALEAALATTQ